MVFTGPVREGVGPGWTRRAVLVGVGGAAAGGALAGCSWFDSGPPEPPPPDPLEPLLAGTRELIARYEQVLTAHPDLRERLEPLRETHLAHEIVLREAIDRPEPTATATTGVPEWLPPDEPVPGTPAEAIVEIYQAEYDAWGEAATACLYAEPARAGLLGSITAARATHAEVLA